jgi:hypothetical protein
MHYRGHFKRADLNEGKAADALRSHSFGKGQDRALNT